MISTQSIGYDVNKNIRLIARLYPPNTTIRLLNLDTSNIANFFIIFSMNVAMHGIVEKH